MLSCRISHFVVRRPRYSNLALESLFFEVETRSTSRVAGFEDRRCFPPLALPRLRKSGTTVGPGQRFAIAWRGLLPNSLQHRRTTLVHSKPNAKPLAGSLATPSRSHCHPQLSEFLPVLDVSACQPAMRLQELLFVATLAPAVFADVKFTSPAAGANVAPGTISIAWEDSSASPSIDDLSSYTLQLMVGGNEDSNAVRKPRSRGVKNHARIKELGWSRRERYRSSWRKTLACDVRETIC